MAERNQARFCSPQCRARACPAAGGASDFSVAAQQDQASSDLHLHLHPLFSCPFWIPWVQGKTCSELEGRNNNSDFKSWHCQVGRMCFTYISSRNQLKAGESQDVYEKAFRGKSEPWTGLLREVAGLHLGSCQGFSVRPASFSFMALMVKLLLFLDSAPQAHLPDGTMWMRIMVQKVILNCCDCPPQDTLILANAAARCFIDILVPPR